MRFKLNSNKAKGVTRSFDVTKYMVYVIFVFAIIIFSVWLGNTFFSLSNVLNITRQTAMISVMAVAMVFVIATGGIDLTVSGIVPVAGLLAAYLLQYTNNIWIAVLIPLILGAMVGLINGLLLHILICRLFL